MTLEQLKQSLADAKAEGQKLCAAIEAAGEATEEQNARVAELTNEITDLEDQIQKAKAVRELRRQAEPVGGAAGRNAVHDLDPVTTHGFANIGEFATAVVGAVRAGQVGGSVDTRLSSVAGTHQGGGSAGEGYILPPQYRDQVWELVTGFDEFGSVIDEEPTSSREVKLGADESTPWGTSGVKAYWRAEGSQMTASQLDTDGRSVPLHEMYCLALATEELLEDAPRLNNRLTRKAAQAIAWTKNSAIVEGSGAGQPLGWMASKALITVSKESGQAANTITANNVIAMYSRLQMLPGDAPFWMVNQNTLPQLMTMTIGDKPIWVPPTGLAAAPGGFLLGLPVRFSEFAETLGDKGDIQLVSPRGYYGVRRTQGIDFASSIHLYFDRGIEAFRWTFRYGGQPHLSKPVSPAKGDATRSHFVTLAARG